MASNVFLLPNTIPSGPIQVRAKSGPSFAPGHALVPANALAGGAVVRYRCRGGRGEQMNVSRARAVRIPGPGGASGGALAGKLAAGGARTAALDTTPAGLDALAEELAGKSPVRAVADVTDLP